MTACSGSGSGSVLGAPHPAVSEVSEVVGTRQTALIPRTVGEADMASKANADGGIVVYRTVQRSPGLMGRTVGPLFSTMAEAKAVAEDFAANGLNAEPTTWVDADDGRGTVEMVPASTRYFPSRKRTAWARDRLLYR